MQHVGASATNSAIIFVVKKCLLGKRLSLALLNGLIVVTFQVGVRHVFDKSELRDQNTLCA